MAETILVALAAFAVLVVSVVLVLHPDYEDGLVGRIGLALIGIAALARVLGILTSEHPRQFSSIALMLWIGLALFMLRHAWRFMRWRRCGEGDWRAARWREPEAGHTGGKR